MERGSDGCTVHNNIIVSIIIVIIIYIIINNHKNIDTNPSKKLKAFKGGNKHHLFWIDNISFCFRYWLLIDEVPI